MAFKKSIRAFVALKKAFVHSWLSQKSICAFVALKKAFVAFFKIAFVAFFLFLGA